VDVNGGYRAPASRHAGASAPAPSPPDQVVTDSDRSLLDWHPRNPYLRTEGSHEPIVLPVLPAQSLPVDPAGSSSPSSSTTTATESGAPAQDARTGAAKIAMLIGLGGGFLQNGIDVARLIKKYPEALRAGSFEPGLGRLGRLPTAVGLTFLTRADNRIVDPLAPRVASAASLGRSFTRFDELAMKSSVLLGASLAAIQIGASIPNLMDALDNEGPWYANLAGSTSGRAGVLQLSGGVIGAAVFATALRQTAGQAGTDVVARVLAAGKAPIMARPLWGRIGLATGALVAANELGYLDMFNAGERRATPTVLAEAARKTPVINDSTGRTAVLLGVGGMIGFKAHRGVLAAGGALSGISKGHIVGGAVVAGLLGAQLLGGLHTLDKR
jgi:hypothetical protein